ncbi:MAG: response regulator transcription factor [Saprospiraceae bacterium]|nr:response regulator transcription factor [Candidatus Opimibacter iunctus]
MEKIKIALVDDNFHTRQSIKELLGYSKGLEICLLSDSGKSFLTYLKDNPDGALPDVVLMDIDMPELDGIDTVAIAKTVYPSIRFLMLTVYDDEDLLFRAIKAGASGFLLKDEKINVIEQHIFNLYKGIDAPMSPSIAQKALSLIHRSNVQEDRKEENGIQAPLDVSAREIEVLQLLVDGYNYKDIGDKLFISYNTVKKHVANIYEKLHVTSKAQAIKVSHYFNLLK